MSALRTPTRRASARLAVAVALVGAFALTGCTASGDDLGLGPAASETATPTPAPSASAPAAPSQCAPTTIDSPPPPSYAPDGPTPPPTALPAGSTMATIQGNGMLKVGVSADTLLVGSRNPLSGQIEGLDIDMLHQISTAIFGDPDHLQFTVITAAQRIPALQDHQVDIVARAMTITCDRWTQIAFSTEYYHAGQKVLVARDSDATSLNDLSGKKVCAPVGTTTLTKLNDFPEVTPVSAATHTGCLVLFQQGKVDGIAGDDTILAGFAAQDPYAKVVGDAITAEPYGLGIAADQVDLVRFVNGVLDTMRADGTWTAIYNKWFSVLGPAPAPPLAVYGRTP
jgi:polar amino acid transport system substrate-binding protein